MSVCYKPAKRLHIQDFSFLSTLKIEKKMVLKYIEYEIELINDESYIIDSSDNSTNYDFEYEANPDSTTRHGVVLKRNGEVVKSAILFGNEKQTVIHSKSAIVFDDMLILCVSNRIFCLYLPSLELRWVKEIDAVACLQLFKTSESYLVHGDLSICRIEFTGDIIWRYKNEDIFVFKKANNNVELTARGIEITAWNNKKYLLGYDGRLISET